MSLYDRFLVTLFFLANLVGKFTLSRIGGETVAESLLGEVRIPLFGLLLLALLPLIAHERFIKAPAWFVRAIIFFAYMAISALWATDPKEAAKISFDFILLGLDLGLALVIFKKGTVGKTRYFFLLFWVTAILYAVAGLTGIWSQDGRMTAFGGGPNVFVRIMSIGFFVSLYFWIYRKKMLWLLPTPLFLYCAVASESRGGIIALVVALIIALFILAGKHGFRQIIKLIAWTSMAIFILLVLPTGRKLSTIWQSRFVESTFQNKYFSGRSILYFEAWELFIHKPIVGAGVDGFRQATATNLNYAHNLFLSVACEGGSIGLALLAFTLITLAFRLLSLKTLDQKAAIILGSFIFIASQFSGNYYDTRLMWIFFVISVLPRLPKAVHSGPAPAPILRGE